MGSFDSRYGPPNGRNSRYRDNGGRPEQGWDIPRNVLLFVLVYAVLRAVLNISRKYIGHRDNLDLPRWSWRKEVGLPDEEMPEGTPMIKQPKRRSFGDERDCRGSERDIERQRRTLRY